MRESIIEKYLVKRVKQMGGEIRKLQWAGRSHAPDRMVLLQHQMPFLVELKATGEVPRPGQVREHARLIRFGMRVEVVDSIERVEEILA